MRHNALLVVNGLLLLSVVLQIVSGFFLRSDPIFRFIHFHNPYLLITLVIAHLTLNWWWIKRRVFGIKGPSEK